MSSKEPADISSRRCRPLKTLKDWLRHIFFGMCIGASDLVPGISGGTMALILGVYEDLIDSIKSLGTSGALSLFRFRFAAFSQAVAWDFLAALILGAAISFAALTPMVHSLLQHQDYRKYLYGFFFGLVIASVFICRRRLQALKPIYGAYVAVGALAAFLLTWAGAEQAFEGPLYDIVVPAHRVALPQGQDAVNYDLETERILAVSEATVAAMLHRGVVGADTAVYTQDTGQKKNAADFAIHAKRQWIQPFLVLAGALAISAMLLPGISGTYVLAMIGAYATVINALADCVRGFDADAIQVLGNLLTGIIIGALLFSRCIAWLLRWYHDPTLATLIGFMLGAIGTIWPFWTYEFKINPLKPLSIPTLVPADPYFPSPFQAEAVLVAATSALGFLLVSFLEGAAAKKSIPLKEAS